jgi:hypothetical protein
VGEVSSSHHLSTSLLHIIQVLIARNRTKALMDSPHTPTYISAESVYLHKADFMQWTVIPQSVTCDLSVGYAHWQCFGTHTKTWLVGQLLVSNFAFFCCSCPCDTREGSGADSRWLINLAAGLLPETTRAQWAEHPERITVLNAGGGLQTCTVIVRIAHFVPHEDMDTPAPMTSLSDWLAGACVPDEVRAALHRSAKDRPTSVMDDHDHLKDVGNATQRGNSKYNHTVLTQTLHILGITKSEVSGRPATVHESFEYLFRRLPNLFLKYQPDARQVKLFLTTFKFPSCLSDLVLAYVGKGMTVADTLELFSSKSTFRQTHNYYLTFGGVAGRKLNRADDTFRVAECMHSLHLAKHLAAHSDNSQYQWLDGVDHFGKSNQGLHQVIAAQIDAIQNPRCQRRYRRTLEELATSRAKSNTVREPHLSSSGSRSSNSSSSSSSSRSSAAAAAVHAPVPVPAPATDSGSISSNTRSRSSTLNDPPSSLFTTTKESPTPHEDKVYSFYVLSSWFTSY